MLVITSAVGIIVVLMTYFAAIGPRRTRAREGKDNKRASMERHSSVSSVSAWSPEDVQVWLTARGYNKVRYCAMLEPKDKEMKGWGKETATYVLMDLTSVHFVG